VNPDGSPVIFQGSSNGGEMNNRMKEYKRVFGDDDSKDSPASQNQDFDDAFDEAAQLKPINKRIEIINNEPETSRDDIEKNRELLKELEEERRSILESTSLAGISGPEDTDGELAREDELFTGQARLCAAFGLGPNSFEAVKRRVAFAGMEFSRKIPGDKRSSPQLYQSEINRIIYIWKNKKVKAK
jgi:hypothetical protein